MGVVLDLDFYDAAGVHARLPDEVRSRFEAAWDEPDPSPDTYLPGSLAHHTPRGERVIFVLTEPETDAKRWVLAADGAASWMNASLACLGLAGERDAAGKPRNGLVVDSCYLDLGRFQYTPSAVVKGEARRAPLLAESPPFTAAQLLEHAPPEPPPAVKQPRPAKVRDPRASTELTEAVARWNADHPEDWPRAGGYCPACGHRGCFGRLPQRTGKWSCFSDQHEADSGGCGQPGHGCWFGDALDLEAHARKRERVDVLREDGYLVDRHALSSRPKPDGPPPSRPPSPDALAAGDPRGAAEAADVGAPATFNATDLGNAERLAAHCSDRLRYCAPWREWLTWDGRRWARDRDGEGVRLGKETVRAIYAEASRLAGESERRKLAQHAMSSEAQRRIAGMLELAKSDKRIAILPEAFDDPSSRYLLNVHNGTLDLRTGTLRPHRREDHITKLAPVTFDPSARSALWESFLERVVPDGEVRAFLQRYAGSALTGDTGDQAFALLYGTGANGKSTFLETLLALLGDYAHQASFETFLEATARMDRRGGPRSDLVALRGVRFIGAIEAAEGRRLDENVVKQLVGGDTITARGMYQAEETSFVPEAKLFLAANHRLEIRGSDLAIWRRVLEVPFTVTIPEAERDSTLKARLREQRALSGILAWALEGCREWLRAGAGPRLRPPAAVVAATRTYREEQDRLAPFLADRCTLELGAWTASKALRGAYVSWCEVNSEQPMSTRELARRLEAVGCRKERRGRASNMVRGWAGVRLLPTPDIGDGDIGDIGKAFFDKPTLVSPS